MNENSEILKELIINNEIDRIKDYFNENKDNYNIINNSLTEQGSTALMIASSLGYLNLVEYFIQTFQNKIDINKINNNGTTALIFACNNGDFSIVKYLCEHGANINTIIHSGDTPLTISASNGFEEICYYLCSNEIPIVIDHINNEGKTALICAIEEGHNPIVSLLLQFGANINLITEVTLLNGVSRCSALVIACLYDEFEIVQNLLHNKADSSLISDYIISSQVSPKYINSIENENENESNNNDNNDNHNNIQSNYLPKYRQLIRTELLNYGWLPRLDIKRCCEIDDIDTFRKLLEEYQYSNSILSLLTNEVVSLSGGATGFFIAALHGSKRIIEEIFHLASPSSPPSSSNLLYSQSINLRCQTNDRRNVLFYATYNGHSIILTYLLQNGLIDIINQVNINNESPLYYACLNGHIECVRILINYGCYISDNITNDIICQNMIQNVDYNKNNSNDNNKKYNENNSYDTNSLKDIRKNEIMCLLGRI